MIFAMDPHEQQAVSGRLERLKSELWAVGAESLDPQVRRQRMWVLIEAINSTLTQVSPAYLEIR